MKLFIVLLSCMLTFQLPAQKTSLSDLSCEHKVNPTGVDAPKPRFSWKLNSQERNVLQTAYSLRVSSTPNFSKDRVWETGKVTSGESVLIPYAGSALHSGTRYYWQVKIWDNKKRESSWSAPAYFETGLQPQDWKAQWIEPVQDTARRMPGLLLRHEMSINKKIASARAYVTSHGFYEFFINGKRVGDDVLTPGWTAYQKRLQYQVYDVTGLLQQGRNALGAMLGDGWYRGSLAWENNWGIWGKKLGLLAQINIRYSDGTEETFVAR